MRVQQPTLLTKFDLCVAFAACARLCVCACVFVGFAVMQTVA